jgi:hypothetical protein
MLEPIAKQVLTIRCMRRGKIQKPILKCIAIPTTMFNYDTAKLVLKKRTIHNI